MALLQLPDIDHDSQSTSHSPSTEIAGVTGEKSEGGGTSVNSSDRMGAAEESSHGLSGMESAVSRGEDAFRLGKVKFFNSQKVSSLIPSSSSLTHVGLQGFGFIVDSNPEDLSEDEGSFFSIFAHLRSSSSSPPTGLN